MKKIIFIAISCLTLAVTSIVGIASINPGVPQAKRGALDYDQTVFAQGSSEGGVNVYTDADNNEYIFDENGVQVGYRKSVSGIQMYSGKTGKIDLDEAVTIADNVLRSTIKTEQDYTMTDAQYLDDLEIYSITYHHIVDGYRTSDYAFMFISDKGELLSYAAPNVGSFANVVVPEIDRSEIERFVCEQITQANDYVDCSVNDMMLIRKGDLLKLSVSYTVTMNDGSLFADTYIVDLN